MNEGKSSLVEEMVRALEALHSGGSKMTLSVQTRWETHFVSQQEKEKWIKEYVVRETAVARKLVQDAETGIIQEPEDMRNAESVGSTSRKLEKTSEEMFNAIGDSLSNYASSVDEDDWDDK